MPIVGLTPFTLNKQPARVRRRSEDITETPPLVKWENVKSKKQKRIQRMNEETSFKSSEGKVLQTYKTKEKLLQSHKDMANDGTKRRMTYSKLITDKDINEVDVQLIRPRAKTLNQTAIDKQLHDDHLRWGTRYEHRSRVWVVEGPNNYTQSEYNIFLNLLTQDLTNCESILQLSLRRILFNCNQLPLLLKAADTCRVLSHLCLSRCGINDELFTTLLSYLPKMIKRLEIPHNKITTVGVEVFCSILVTEYNNIEAVSFHGNKTGDGPCRAIADLLSENSLLRDVNLSFMEITDGGAVQLARVIPDLKGLQQLHLEGNLLSLSSGITLFEAMKKNRSITSLRLRHCRAITSCIMKAISQRLESNKLRLLSPTLRSILSRNNGQLLQERNVSFASPTPTLFRQFIDNSPSARRYEFDETHQTIVQSASDSLASSLSQR